jgi:hypothetical protein
MKETDDIADKLHAEAEAHDAAELAEEFRAHSAEAIIPEPPPLPDQIAPDPSRNPLYESALRSVAASDIAGADFVSKLRNLCTQFLINSGAQLPASMDPDSGKPVWGPCTRCGHVWLGHSVERIPRWCARCHSSYWQTAPVRQDIARQPGDPPAAGWKGRKVTRRPRKVRRVVYEERSATPASVTASTGIASLAPIATREAFLEHLPPQPVGLRPPPDVPDILKQKARTPLEQATLTGHSEPFYVPNPNPPPTMAEVLADIEVLRVPAGAIEEIDKKRQEVAERIMRSIPEVPPMPQPPDPSAMSRDELVDYIRGAQPTPAEQVADFISQTPAPSMSDPAKLDAFFSGGGASAEEKAKFFADNDKIDLRPRILPVDDIVQPKVTRVLPADVPAIVNQSAVDDILSKLDKK